MSGEVRDVLKDARAEGKEKHVPEIEVEKGGGGKGVDAVRVIVGQEVPHPNTVEHHIVWIELYGVKKGGQVIDSGRTTFAPAYTSPHGLWENCIEL